MRAANLCLACRSGRHLCGHRSCPLLPRLYIKTKLNKIPQHYFGPAPSIFIGHENWPNVNIGPLACIEEKQNIENPQAWFGLDYSSIIELRSAVLRGKKVANIFSSERVISSLQEIALARSWPDVEIRFRGKPQYRFTFSDITNPIGPSARIDSLQLAENPKTIQSAEKILSDEMKARDAVERLYSIGIDIYKISTLLSAGLFGIQRRLVPTRWSITAAHKMVADRLIEKIKNFRQAEKIMLFSSTYLDNHFEILLIPGHWEFENFEAWAPGSLWAASAKSTQIAVEYEPYRGRSDYAESQAGGYYASRLGVAEGLLRLKRQAKVVVFREVYEGYVIPVGVWQVLENVRNAFRQKPRIYDRLDDAFKDMRCRLRLDIDGYRKMSRILSQKRLCDFTGKI
ncbi:MAG: hypothetical protein QXG26_02310 [Candidatus Aenigmatarchaeota archaeon]